jgi:hypothetical protein
MTAHFPGLADLKKTFEDTKGLIRRRNSKKDKQHNGKKRKRPNKGNNKITKIK